MSLHASLFKSLIAFFFSFFLLVSPVSAAGVKKVLFIDSYHSGYAWSDGVVQGVKKGLGLDNQAVVNEKSGNDNVELKIVHMDTKRNNSEAFKREAAGKARDDIYQYKPDIVIASDDNASKYLITKYFLNTDLPVVFCGVNWDASVYGFPAANVTGMEEVTLAVQTIDMMKEYAKGDRLGIIAADTLSERKTVENIRRKFGIVFQSTYFVKSFEQWKAQFAKLQDEVDMILFTNYIGIEDWRPEAAMNHIQTHIRVPVGTMDTWVADYALIGLTKVASEQGEWAAKTALSILNGESPKDIPVVTNEKADIYLNLRIAKKLGIKFPMELLSWVNVID